MRDPGGVRRPEGEWPVTAPDLPSDRYGGQLVDLDLVATLRSTGAARRFEPEPVSDGVLARLLDTARFAPSGGNRQGWRVIVVKDMATRTALRDIYLAGWYEYLAIGAGGARPLGAGHRPGRRGGGGRGGGPVRGRGGDAPGFAEHLDTAPALLLVLADLAALAAVDRDLPRYTLVGGASIYPFVWSLLLAARAEGLGGVTTTVAIRHEPELRALFGIPDSVAVAALVVLGRPVDQPSRLGAGAGALVQLGRPLRGDTVRAAVAVA